MPKRKREKGERKKNKGGTAQKRIGKRGMGKRERKKEKNWARTRVRK